MNLSDGIQVTGSLLCGVIVVALTLCSCLGAGQAAAQEAIGTVSQGDASGTRGTTTQPLGANVSVYPNEAISTGDGTRALLVFVPA
jgi:hypothetical protein